MEKYLPIYDLAIVGAGSAGYAASIYASRYKLSNIILGELPGGMIGEASEICNYPGFQSITGVELAQKFEDHAVSLGAHEYFSLVEKIEKEGEEFEVVMKDGKLFRARTILLAHGHKRRKLNLPKEKELSGKGVSYCATCEAPFFKDKVVGVIGGGNSAHTAVLQLSAIAKEVYQIYRGTEFKGDRVWIEQNSKNPKIKILFETNVVELLGEGKLEGVKLDREYQASDSLRLDGLFIEIGSEPDTTLAEGLGLEVSEKGLIKVTPDQTTSVSGVFAAGDVTDASNSFRQIVTASAEGSIAADSAYKYLAKREKVSLDQRA